MALTEDVGRSEPQAPANRTSDRPLSPQPSRQQDRFERLLAAGLEIFSQRSIEGVLQHVADAARDVVGARYAALGVFSEDGGSLSQFVTSGLSQADRERIGDSPTGQGLLDLLIGQPEPIRATDIKQRTRRYGFTPHHPPMQSFLGVPIVSRDRVFGKLYVTEKIGGDGFDAEDERIAILLARKAGVAVENARLLEQLREFQASRDRFYAMMNHELRNALTGVYGWLDLLVRRGRSTAPHAAIQAMAAAEESVQLLNDLLDLSRLDAGRLEMNAHEIVTEMILGEALSTVGPLADAGGVRLEASIESRTTARTDPKRIRQILVNLLRNAIQYSPRDEAVRVVLTATDSLVSFSVIDRGPGIDAEQQQYLFDAYAGSHQERAGTGLGLTLSRRLARLLGGDIAVQSDPGHGATFTLQIARVVHPG